MDTLAMSTILDTEAMGSQCRESQIIGRFQIVGKISGFTASTPCLLARK
ncbi:MAG: hypothetical protein HYX97_06175 [Chloroflexi bacterium]|nr:hypothetical protein [Chloroflexota bacterium]